MWAHGLLTKVGVNGNAYFIRSTWLIWQWKEQLPSYNSLPSICSKLTFLPTYMYALNSVTVEIKVQVPDSAHPMILCVAHVPSREAWCISFLGMQPTLTQYIIPMREHTFKIVCIFICTSIELNHNWPQHSQLEFHVFLFFQMCCQVWLSIRCNWSNSFSHSWSPFGNHWIVQPYLTGIPKGHSYPHHKIARVDR